METAVICLVAAVAFLVGLAAGSSRRGPLVQVNSAGTGQDVYHDVYNAVHVDGENLGKLEDMIERAVVRANSRSSRSA